MTGIERIEALEARVQSLEARLTIIEQALVHRLDVIEKQTADILAIVCELRGDSR